MTLPLAAGSDAVLGALRAVMREMAQGRPLDRVLTVLSQQAEGLMAETRCSVLLLKENRLRHGAAPSLPEVYVRAIDGLEIGPQVGSCGAAAFTGRRVVVRDVLTHPNWAPFRDLARSAEIRSCWSEPILSSEREVLGTFAMYGREPREPRDDELDFIASMAQMAAIAIEADRSERKRRLTEQSLAESEERFRQLAETISEVFYLTEWDPRTVLYVSPAYEKVWGRSCQSLIDDPRSWVYDIHPDDRERALKSFLDGATEGTFDVEYRIVRADGTERWIHDRAFPVYRNGVPYRIAGLSADITRRKDIELALERALTELEASSRRRVSALQSDLLLAEERERRRLAIDLHDGLSQVLTLARMKLGRLARTAEGKQREAIDDVARLVQGIEKTARTLTFQLSPPVLHDIGFAAAVQCLVEDVHESYGLSVDLIEHDPPEDLDADVRVLLYRAVRELLINVAKHARAGHARVRLGRMGRNIEVRVEDDGVATEPLQPSTRGVGLSSIRERLESLGGQMFIRAAPGTGTSVTLVSPTRLRADAAAGA